MSQGGEENPYGSGGGGTPAAPSISPVAAVTGTFFQPGMVFEKLAVSPTWWLPFVLMMLTVLGAVLVATPKIDMEATVREAIQKRTEKTGQVVSEAVIRRQVEISEKIGKYAAPIAMVISCAVFFLTVLVLWGAARAFGSEVSFVHALTAWGHANLPNVLGGLISIPIFLSVADASLTQTAAQHFFKSNIGAFMGDDTVAWLRSLLTAFDLFSIWSLTLLVLGFRRFPGLATGPATAIPIVLWGIYVVIKVGWAALMG